MRSLRSKSLSFTSLAPFIFLIFALVTASVIVRSPEALTDFPLTEDGFYMLSVSRSIATGNGVTIDGSHLTNGFQPLFAFLVTPVYMFFGGDRIQSLRGVLALHWLIQVLTALLLGSIVRDGLRLSKRNGSAVYWLTALLWLTSIQVLSSSFNGLETGLVLLFYALAWRLYQLGWSSGWRLICFGVTLGLLILARIDAAIFVVIFLAMELVRAGERVSTRFTRGAIIGFVALLVSLPWWLYNVLIFGALMPSSGTAQSAPFTLSRVLPLIEGMLRNWVPYIPVDSTGNWWIQASLHTLQAMVLLVAIVLFVRSTLPELSRSRTLRFGCALVVSTSVLAFYYLLSSSATWFYFRYLTPYLLVAVPVASISLLRAPRLASRARLALVVPIGLFALISIYAWFTPGAGAGYYTDQLQVIKTHVPPGDVVAGGQTGTIGYFRDHVVNLDGKVNPEALAYQDNMFDYLEREDIVWYCDWFYYSNKHLGPDPSAHGWTRVAKRGAFELFHRTDAQIGSGTESD